MFGGGFSADKLKANLKMAAHRITLTMQKKQNLIKKDKREIAQLLADGKEEKARIRVENVIREDFTIEGLEIIQLMCELAVTRLPLIRSERDCPYDMRETIATLMYAATRTDIPELLEVRKQLTLKYGKEFSANAAKNADGCVNVRVVQKLSVLPPNGLLVMNYMKEIAKQYSVDWEPENPDLVAPDLPMAAPSGHSVMPSAGSGYTHLYAGPESGGYSTVAAPSSVGMSMPPTSFPMPPMPHHSMPHPSMMPPPPGGMAGGPGMPMHPGGMAGGPGMPMPPGVPMPPPPAGSPYGGPAGHSPTHPPRGASDGSNGGGGGGGGGGYGYGYGYGYGRADAGDAAHGGRSPASGYGGGAGVPPSPPRGSGGDGGSGSPPPYAHHPHHASSAADGPGLGGGYGPGAADASHGGGGGGGYGPGPGAGGGYAPYAGASDGPGAGGGYAPSDGAGFHIPDAPTTSATARGGGGGGRGGGGGGGGGAPHTASSTTGVPGSDAAGVPDFDELAARFEALKRDGV